jgi:hypothetical protein
MIYAARPVACINSGFEAQLRAYIYAKYDVYVAQQVLLLGTFLLSLFSLVCVELMLVQLSWFWQVACKRSKSIEPFGELPKTN